MDSVQIISHKSLLLQFTIFRIVGSNPKQVSPLVRTALESQGHALLTNGRNSLPYSGVFVSAFGPDVDNSGFYQQSLVPRIRGGSVPSSSFPFRYPVTHRYSKRSGWRRLHIQYDGSSISVCVRLVSCCIFHEQDCYIPHPRGTNLPIICATEVCHWSVTEVWRSAGITGSKLLLHLQKFTFM